jgi:sec-independent protein translocase protein TatA
MGLSLTHIILLLVVVLVIFGVGKLPNVMGDLGKGIRNFKSGLNDDNKPLEKAEEKTDEKLPPPPAA